MAKSKLAPYRAKRDFKTTTEPSGRTTIRAAEYARFVIQKHDATRLHFDLRLEIDGVFKSWAVTRGPSLDPRDKRLAVEVEDHPLEYGDFEGTIPKGQYGGGTVMVWDRGFWMPEDGAAPAKAIAAGELKFALAGDKLKGSWVLVRMKRDRDGGKRNNWLLIKHRDEFSRSSDSDPGAEDRSAASGRSMAQIATGKGRGPRPFMLAVTVAADPQAVWHSRPRGATPESTSKPRSLPKAEMPSRHGTRPASMPRFIAPQLCRAVSHPPDGPGWVHEIKLDGYRMQLRIENGKVALHTRKGLDWSKKFPEIAAAARSLPDAIIDGEVAALEHRGVSDFPALQVALSERRTDDLIFFAFDLLYVDGKDMRALPLAERKERLGRLLHGKAGGSPRIRFVEHVTGSGDKVLASARNLGLEGIVSKNLHSPYRSGRSDTWTKAKCRVMHEVVIGGWSGGRDQLRSLIAGVYRGDHLVHVGRVGTGYDAGTAKTLLKQLNPLAAKTNPFGGKDAPRREAGVTWVEPKLVAEIEFAGWTGAGMVREAAFKRLRTGRTAKNVRTERPAHPDAIEPAGPAIQVVTRSPMTPAKAGNNTVMGITISNPDKELWPAHGKDRAVGKLDLAHYLEQIGPWMLAHIEGRPCSIIRAPDGIAAEQFFQRHAMAGMKRISLTKVAGDPKSYLQIDTVEGIVAMGQMAAVEFHPWNCHPFQPDVPGRLVFDLDPAPDVAFEAVIDAAKDLRSRLEHLGLAGFCKTTGGKGLHVVVPLRVDGKNGLGWGEAKAFAEAVCARMAADAPQHYLIKMTKKLRTGRIFLDYLRNDRKATAVAPLSPRARPGAPVSMPIGWSQVRKGLNPQRFTIWTAAGLMAKSSAWADYADAAQPLEPAIRRLTGK